MLTLGIETATDVCAVALLDGEDVRFEASIHVPRSHGRRLAPLIGQAFEHVGQPPRALDLVAVSSGPGSYTGLRIGMSTAKGLVLATGARLVAVPTLDALASVAPAAPVVVVLPSRRGEVYAAVAGDADASRPATALALDEARTWLPDVSSLALGGPAANALVEAVPDRTWQRLDLVPSAAAIARLGRQRSEAGDLDDPAATEPTYLKPVAASRPRAIFGS